MKNTLAFNRSYMAFSNLAEPYQRADDVGYVVTQFMTFGGKPYYPIGTLATARIGTARLSAGEFDETDEDNLDLVFRMRETDGGWFFEIILRSNAGTSYGGWLWGREIEVLDEVINGYHVVMTSAANDHLRYEYCAVARLYKSTQPLPVEKHVIDREIRA